MDISPELKFNARPYLKGLGVRKDEVIETLNISNTVSA